MYCKNVSFTLFETFLKKNETENYYYNNGNNINDRKGKTQAIYGSLLNMFLLVFVSGFFFTYNKNLPLSS